MQSITNQQKGMRKWTTREACTYFQKAKKQLEFFLPTIVGATIPLLVLLLNDEWMASNGTKYL